MTKGAEKAGLPEAGGSQVQVSSRVRDLPGLRVVGFLSGVFLLVQLPTALALSGLGAMVFDGLLAASLIGASLRGDLFAGTRAPDPGRAEDPAERVQALNSWATRGVMVGASALLVLAVWVSWNPGHLGPSLADYLRAGVSLAIAGLMAGEALRGGTAVLEIDEGEGPGEGPLLQEGTGPGPGEGDRHSG